MNVWNNFWKKKGKDIEWTKESILHSKNSHVLAKLILKNLKKKTFKGVHFLELGSGIGLSSYFFAYNGADVTLLDNSREVKSLAKNYFENIPHNFISSDLFKFKSKREYDVVMSFGLCEHFIGNKRNEVLQKHIDLLGRKGMALISVPHKYGIFYRIGKSLAELTGFWNFGLEVPFSKKELINFAKKNNLSYEIIMGGFWSSAYDLFVRKPLKVLKIRTKRRLDNTKSIFDQFFGSGIVIILYKA